MMLGDIEVLKGFEFYLVDLGKMSSLLESGFMENHQFSALRHLQIEENLRAIEGGALESRVLLEDLLGIMVKGDSLS